jgi:hypothetical protein
MMKFLYGLVLLVATLPLSAATPDIDYAVFINAGYDCEDDYMDDNVWSAFEAAAAALDVGEYASTINRKKNEAVRRGLRGDPWMEQRELGPEDCPDVCLIEACCHLHQSYCGWTCSNCYNDCRRRDLQNTLSQTAPGTRVAALEHEFTRILRNLAEGDNSCLGPANMISVDVLRQ